jgi:enoyl-CoA hydratase
MPNILTEIKGHVAIITLNRTEALNALTHDMVKDIRQSLDTFSNDDRVRTVVVRGAGDRGLCAGGDIRAIHEDALRTRRKSPAFWADEYRLNLEISNYSKPYVAIMDGIVMGGGVGISAHAAFRVVTERTILAMPEVAIGLVPDVGGTYLLARAPDNAGVHTALTAARLDASDTIYANLADTLVPHHLLDELIVLLAEVPAQDAVAKVGNTPWPSKLASDMLTLRHKYDAPSVLQVLQELNSDGDAVAQSALRAIRTHSPTSLDLTFEAIRRVRVWRMDLETALEQEYRIMNRIHASHDALEGIRAQIIDKDREPRWLPASLEDLDPSERERYFDPLC